MKQIDKYYKVKKADVSFICTYLEAHEGMAAIRTPKPEIGEETVLHMMVSPDFQTSFNKFIRGLKKDIYIRETGKP